jgi:hypothetical protein
MVQRIHWTIWSMIMCYGVGYNNTTIAKVEHLVGINSHVTQVALLQFEWMWTGQDRLR